MWEDHATDSITQGFNSGPSEVDTLNLNEPTVLLELPLHSDNSSDISAPSLLQSDLSTELSMPGHSNIAPSSASSANQRKGKAQAPIDCSNLCRSNRANKYDGFRVHQSTDSHPYKSKVKARVIPSARKSQNTSDNPEGAEEIPPPTTIPVMQAVGVQLYAVPEDELTVDALTKEPEGPSSSSA